MVIGHTMYLFHLYLHLFHGHTTQFGDDQLMERLLDAIMWSGYVGRTALVHICAYKANPVRSFSCEDAVGIIEKDKGRGVALTVFNVVSPMLQTEQIYMCIYTDKLSDGHIFASLCVHYTMRHVRH